MENETKGLSGSRETIYQKHKSERAWNIQVTENMSRLLECRILRWGATEEGGMVIKQREAELGSGSKNPVNLLEHSSPPEGDAER